MPSVPLFQFSRALEELADAIGASYDDFNVSDRKPDIRLVPGNTATSDGGDCDVCWVVDRGVQVAQIPNFDTQRCAIVAEQLVSIELERCWPEVTDQGTVDPDEQTQATLRLAEDKTVLWYGIGSRWTDKTLFPSYPGLDCDAVRFGSLLPRGPQGGIAGWTWQLQLRMYATALAD